MLTVDQTTGSITMDRGDYFDPIFTIYDPVTGLPKDCTGASFKLTVKASLEDDISAAIFQLDSAAAQFDVTGIAAGVVQAKGPETLSLGMAGDYVYDLEMVLGAKTRTVQRAAVLTVLKEVTTPGAVVSPLGVTEIVASPGGIFGFTLQAAIDYVRPRATKANPWTIHCLAGVHESDATINGSGLTGVRFTGRGRHATIIRATSAWVTANNGVADAGFLTLSSADDVVVENMEIDGGTYYQGLTGLVLTKNLHGVNNDNQLGKITFINTNVLGLTYSFGALVPTGPSDALFEVYNSRCEGPQGIRAGAEIWHMFDCDIRATIRPGQSLRIPNCVAVQPGLGAVAQNWQLWGCHIHAEHSGLIGGGLAAQVLAPVQLGNPTSPMAVELIGCILHVHAKDGTEPTATCDVAGVSYGSASIQNSDVHLVGCEFIIETGTYTSRFPLVGAVVTRNNLNANNKLSIVDGDYVDRAGSGGAGRGALASIGGISSINFPTTRVVGGNFPVSAGQFGVAQANISSKSSDRITGAATLVAGVAKVLLVTDAGNVEGAAAMSFTAGSATVTGSGTTFLTTLREGDFIKRATVDGDECWTRVKRIASDTSLTLEENYRGTTQANTQGRRATANENTHWNGTAASPATYRVHLTPTTVPTATDKFYVTAKHASGFTITSLDGASTTTLDWVLTR